MTITKNYHEIVVGNDTYWREQYRDKEMSVFLWRYGYNHIILSDYLLSRPNLKKFFKL